MGQGFERRRFIADRPRDPESERTADRRIADAALKELDHIAKDGRPFFAWVFFVGPHGPYVSHEPGGDQKDRRGRYLEEIQNMDVQFGRLLDALEQKGLLEKTIIVFLSDHGEEFREHGGTRHKRTLYEESVHVPLLIRVPGMAGTRVEKPVSTLYVFPWLFLHSEGKVREFALDRLKRQIGPMLRDTNNAVVSELIGHDRMLAALTYPGMRIHYDFRTQLYQLFDLTEDPGEHRDLMLRDPGRAPWFIDQVDAYKTIRAGIQQAITRPDKRRATPEDLKEDRREAARAATRRPRAPRG
jgi:arylsulfatase A-like enzyme